MRAGGGRWAGQHVKLCCGYSPIHSSSCRDVPLRRSCLPAGAVTYKTDNFLTKNRDFVVAEHQALLGASQHPFVCALFPADPDEGKAAAGGRGGTQSSYKFASVGSRFKRQLGDLMEALHRMEPHYIRCIKPNSFNRPMAFENMNVLHQVGGSMAVQCRERRAARQNEMHFRRAGRFQPAWHFCQRLA